MTVAHATITALAFALIGCAGNVKMTRLAPSALDVVGKSVEGVVVYQPMLVRVTHTYTSRVDSEGRLIGAWQSESCVPVVQKEELVLMANLDRPLLVANASGPFSAAKFSVAVNNGLLTAVNAEPTQKVSDVLSAVSGVVKEVAALGAEGDAGNLCNAGPVVSTSEHRVALQDQPRLADADLRLVDGRQCGDNLAGRQIGIKNTTTTRRIRAYYRVTGATNGPSEDNRLIGPGQTAWIVCSRPAPGQAMGVEITGQTDG